MSPKSYTLQHSKSCRPIRIIQRTVRGDQGERVRALYNGFTCRTSPEGHDAWPLFAQAIDQGGNDDVEERLHVRLVALDTIFMLVLSTALCTALDSDHSPNSQRAFRFLTWKRNMTCLCHSFGFLPYTV